MPTNVLALGLYATASACFVTAPYFLKLKWFTSKEDQSKANGGFAAAIAINGLFIFFAGIYLLAGTPLGAPYNEYFGSIFTMFGMLLLMGAWSIKNEWDLRPVAYFAAVLAILSVNHAYINQLVIKNASYPLVFIPAALAGFSLIPATHLRSPWASRAAAILMIVLGVASIYIGTTALQGHVARGLAPPK